jgi:hypothetical protein
LDVHCIEGPVWRIRVSKHKLPSAAAVGGFVNAGLVAGTAGHDKGGILIDGLDTTKIQLLGASRGCALLPFPTIIGCAQDRALRAAGPGDAAANVVNTAKVGGSGGSLNYPLGGCGVNRRNHQDDEG